MIQCFRFESGQRSMRSSCDPSLTSVLRLFTVLGPVLFLVHFLKGPMRKHCASLCLMTLCHPHTVQAFSSSRLFLCSATAAFWTPQNVCITKARHGRSVGEKKLRMNLEIIDINERKMYCMRFVVDILDAKENLSRFWISCLFF